MKIQELINHLEHIAPPLYQESYDNSGLLAGDATAELKGVMLCLDSTEEVVEEAIARGCNLIVAHHPIIFKGLKRLTGRNYVERVIINAIRNDIAIYAIHTNLDNVYHQGVNAKIAERLGLQHTRILAPKQQLKKLSVFVPEVQSEGLRQALLAAGAQGVQRSGGRSLSMPEMEASQAGARLEAVFEAGLQGQLSRAIREYANGKQLPFELVSIENKSQQVGSGMVGSLPRPMSEEAFLAHLKGRMGAGCVRHTRLLGKEVETVALCGGAGGFLLGAAKAAGAQFFVTADYKYHEFFDADGRLVIADIGHYESEQFTIELLHEIISQKFSNFAVCRTEAVTNPVNYY